MTVDLIIPKESITYSVDKLKGVDAIFNFLNMFNPFKNTDIGVQISTTIADLGQSTMKSSGKQENEALYNLKVEVVEDVESIYYTDDRILMPKCNASQVTFKKGSSYTFEYDIEAPFTIEFKNIVNTYGVSNNENGTDTLNMYIYSDYLDQLIKVPQFEIEDREIILFTDLLVPCINELIVNIAKDETKEQKPTFNTIRIECNNQSVGYS